MRYMLQYSMAAQFSLEPFEKRFSSKEQRRAGDTRSAYEHDKARIIHSSAFRRLQNKTQVSAPRESDFHRTRLTHSLEAAQIGEGIATALRNNFTQESLEPDFQEWIPDNHLIDAACYAHDLGHPPLGHAGEEALNSAINRHIPREKCQPSYGGFESNAHTIRLLTTLEPYYVEGGINPTRRTLLAVLKYPLSFRQYLMEPEQVRKCYFESERIFIEWATEPFPASDRDIFLQIHLTEAGSSSQISWNRTLDASLMDYADEIAYCTHDIEDAISRDFIRRAEFQAKIDSYITETAENDILFPLPTTSHAFDAQGLNQIVEELFSNTQSKRKRAISRMIHIFIVSITPVINRQFKHPLLRYGAMMPEKVRGLLYLLRDIVSDLVIYKPIQQMLEARGRRMIQDIFDELINNRNNLSSLYDSGIAAVSRPSQKNRKNANPPSRMVCDYIASMTDFSVERNYHLLFTPGYGSSSDEL